MGVFANVGNFFKSMFSGLIRACKAFLDLAIPIATQIIIGQLKDVALRTVNELSNSDLTNEERREEAFYRIKDYAVNTGINAKDSLINTIIELALQTLKNAIG